ncbi:MAG TPA: thioredoxin family protein [Vicinamibacteria bacterium]|nr:thioredoxin family protein [Vicinamibacteria bacterium]
MTGALALGLLLVGPPAGHGAAPGIRWEKQFESALKKAQDSRKPVLVDFWAEWCGWCHKLDKTTYVDPMVVKLAEGFVAVKVNTEGSPKETAIAVRYDVNSLPTIAFLSPHGRPVLRLNGYQNSQQFPRALEKAREVATKVMAWEAAIDKNPKDAGALHALGVHLFEQDAYRESADLLNRASDVDAGRPLDERKENRLLLGAILKSDERFDDSERVLKAGLALPPNEHFDAKLLYVLGKMYVAWGRREQARTVLQQVVNLHAQSQIAEKARETLVALERK